MHGTKIGLVDYISRHQNQKAKKCFCIIDIHPSHVHKHDSHLSLAPRNHIANTSGNFNSLKYAYPASQIPITSSLAKQNSTHCKQSFQNRNELTLATRETQFYSILIQRAKFIWDKEHENSFKDINCERHGKQSLKPKTRNACKMRRISFRSRGRYGTINRWWV